MEPRIVDHFVLVNGALQLVFEKVEAYHLGVSDEALRFSGGKEANSLSMAEA